MNNIQNYYGMTSYSQSFTSNKVIAKTVTGALTQNAKKKAAAIGTAGIGLGTVTYFSTTNVPRTKVKSDYHDDIDGASSLTIYLATVSEMEAKGASREEIVKKLGSEELLDKVLEKRNKIDASFAEIIPEKYSRTFYKTFYEVDFDKEEDFEALKDAKEGDIITPDYGYMRAYSNYEYERPSQYSLKNSGDAVVLTIQTGSGTQLSKEDFRTWGAEDPRDNLDVTKAIFPRGRQYKVLGKVENNNVTEITLAEVLPVDKNAKKQSGNYVAYEKQTHPDGDYSLYARDEKGCIIGDHYKKGKYSHSTPYKEDGYGIVEGEDTKVYKLDY